MVKATELRIGNWISATEDYETWPSPCLVEGISADGYLELLTDTDYRPTWEPCGMYGIPLTPEILIAAGFEKIIYDAHKRNKVIAERLPEIAAQEMCDFKKSITHDGWQICLEETDCWDVWYGKSENWGDRLILCSLNYVHQLQNLYFALTGQELAINLQTKK